MLINRVRANAVNRAQTREQLHHRRRRRQVYPMFRGRNAARLRAGAAVDIGAITLRPPLTIANDDKKPLLSTDVPNAKRGDGYDRATASGCWRGCATKTPKRRRRLAR